MLSALTAVPLGAAAEKAVVRTRYAIVSGSPEAGPAASRVAALIDLAVPTIAPLVGTADLEPVPARVYPDRASFTRAAGIPRDAPIVGLATFPSGAIHIDGTGILESIEHIVPHEVAHVLVARSVGPALPALPIWVNEGIAEYAAGASASQVDPIALQAVGRGESVPLADLDAAFGAGGETRSLAYAEAASLVHFIIAQRGPSVIAELLMVMRERGDFPAALEQTTGWDMEGLESRWRQSVSHRWRWHLLFRSQALILGLMVLIFIVAYLRHRRERRRRQEMPDADW